MITKYKLFGLQRTCTNTVLWLIKHNFQNLQSMEIGGSWKHGEIKAEKYQDVVFIFCTKEIFSWLNSCYNYFKGSKDKSCCRKFNPNWTLPEFIRSPHYTWANPVVRYKEMNDYYLEYYRFIVPDKGLHVPAESILSPEGQLRLLDTLEKKFDWQRTEKTNLVKKRVNNNCTLHREFLKTEFYLNKEYMQLFTKEDKEFVLYTLRL